MNKVKLYSFVVCMITIFTILPFAKGEPRLNSSKIYSESRNEIRDVFRDIVKKNSINNQKRLSNDKTIKNAIKDIHRNKNKFIWHFDNEFEIKEKLTFEIIKILPLHLKALFLSSSLSLDRPIARGIVLAFFSLKTTSSLTESVKMNLFNVSVELNLVNEMSEQMLHEYANDIVKRDLLILFSDIVQERIIEMFCKNEDNSFHELCFIEPTYVFTPGNLDLILYYSGGANSFINSSRFKYSFYQTYEIDPSNLTFFVNGTEEKIIHYSNALMNLQNSYAYWSAWYLFFGSGASGDIGRTGIVSFSEDDNIKIKITDNRFDELTNTAYFTISLTINFLYPSENSSSIPVELDYTFETYTSGCNYEEEEEEECFF